jgi:hypothetical protein
MPTQWSLPMSISIKHNEFIRDTETLIIYDILPHINSTQFDNCLDLYSSYKEKWKKIFTLKKEETIDETIIKEKEKILQLYDDLKTSINNNYVPEIIDVDVHTSVNTAKEKLQNILLREKQQNCELQITQYRKGSILKQLKRLTNSTKAFKLALKNMMSYGHACKLIRFFNNCERYHILRFTTLPFRKIISNMEGLESLMEQDVAFWNPPAVKQEQQPPILMEIH